MARNDYAPIDDYALIGDCRTAALVSRTGSIDWLCLPNFASASVFAAILDRDRGGHFAIHPCGEFHSSRRYRGDTPVLESVYETPGGRMKVTDAMPVHAGRNASSLQPQRELLRVVEALEGEPELSVEFRPRMDYARKPARFHRMGRTGWCCRSRGEVYFLRADLPLEPMGKDIGLAANVRMQAGERRHLSLSHTTGDVATLPLLGLAADARIEDTCLWWENWSRLCCYDGPYAGAVMRSAITLKLLDYALSGAVVAAPTASLPENIGGSRNWDYRYCWLRDASFTFRSFTELGYTDEADAFLGWLLHSTRLTWPKLQVLYDAHGEIDVREFELDHFEGHRGSRPVRIGNGAKNQLQLDVYGEVILAAYDYAQVGRKLDAFEGRMLRGLGNTVCKLWREADESIWEIRAAPRHYTYSKLMCWVALDRLLKLHEQGHLRVPVGRFIRERDALVASIEARGFNRELNSYVAAFDGDQPDAALLLLSRRGYIDARDPRMQGTFRFLERELSCSGLFYRYRQGFDHLPEPEGTFIACSFWAVDLLVEQGRFDEARRHFERVLECGNELGLLAEQFDAGRGQQCGNFPQAYSHLALIDAALSLQRGERGKQET